YTSSQGESHMKRTIVGLMAAGIAFAAAGCAAVEEEGSGGDAKDMGKPDITVKATKILKEFEDNEASADAKYKGKVLKIKGVIEKIDTELFDDEKYSVQVAGGGDFVVFTVNCNGQSSDAVVDLKKGAKVTVVGEF